MSTSSPKLLASDATAEARGFHSHLCPCWNTNENTERNANWQTLWNSEILAMMGHILRDISIRKLWTGKCLSKNRKSKQKERPPLHPPTANPWQEQPPFWSSLNYSIIPSQPSAKLALFLHSLSPAVGMEGTSHCLLYLGTRWRGQGGPGLPTQYHAAALPRGNIQISSFILDKSSSCPTKHNGNRLCPLQEGKLS